MINITQHRTKILASHFAAMVETHQKSNELGVFVRYNKDEYQHLKRWWDSMDALRIIRYAHQEIGIPISDEETSSNPIDHLSQHADGTILFVGKPIGKIYNYYRTVLPQEIQIRLAYDTLIEGFMVFLQQRKYAIRLSENQLTVSLFIPGGDFQLTNEWQQFIEKFAYSEKELYKSFTLFVNSMKLTNNGFGHIHFPSVTEAMKLWQAAFYIATLRERVVRDSDNYKKAKTDKDREVAAKESKKELKQLLTELRSELQTSFYGSDEVNKITRLFDKAWKLSNQFNRKGGSQFLKTVKPRIHGGKIEDKIIKILSEQVRPLNCPLAPVDEIAQPSVYGAGDTAKNRCYSCGGHLPPKSETRRFKGKLKANRWVFKSPSQRLQSGSGQKEPSICLDCLAVAFGCPIKVADGAIIVRLSTSNGENELVSPEKYLQMLTLGELNLIAGRYLLIQCTEKRGSSKPISEKIGQVQYALWRVAQTLPTGALEKMRFTLFTGESEIRLPTRQLVWLSYLNNIFKPSLIANGKDNIPLCQAIRLIQKDEVISATYKLVTAEFPKVTPIRNRSYSEKRSLEELREKHCDLLKYSSKGDKLMEKQAEFYHDVAALTGLTYAYCDYVRSELRKRENLDTVQREVKKLIEKVVNPSFFSYKASDILPGTRATMYRNDDNYFCYDQAKLLLENTLEVQMSDRAKPDEKGSEPLAIYFDDILNAYAKLSKKYEKAQLRKLSYQLKLNLHAKFASLFS